VDGRADQYAFGVILYEALTGRAPYEGDTAITIAVQHIQGELTPLRSLNPAIPENVAAVVTRALSRDPSDRFPSCLALLADLEGALRNVVGRASTLIAGPAGNPTSAPATASSNAGPGGHTPARASVAGILSSAGSVGSTPVQPATASQLQLAPRISRLVAAAIDLCLALFLPSFVVALIGQLLAAPLILSATAFWLTPLIFWIVCESLWGGTPGKRVFKLRVCLTSGAPVTFVPSILRALFLYPDVLAGPFLIAFTRRRQRLGDLVAGTMVTRSAAPASG
jgi:uncharacterized RDD family membrane protein YckC